CVDYGMYGFCGGTIEGMAVGSRWLVLSDGLPSKEVAKLSCSSSPYSSFYVFDNEHRKEMYDALLYALENNKMIYFSVTENSGVCEVTLVNISSKEE
ncbi:MAG TPA: hypothetical protein VFP95_06720, partial [Gammaproteobacteria bacterium]|nr:hypothetical protein [Gammaproteobacteria bacterium]